jgi:DNA polymerase-1
LFEVSQGEADDTVRAINGVMEGACAPHCELLVPLVVETGYGPNWDEAH